MFKDREVSIHVHKANPNGDNNEEPRNEQAIFEDKVAIVHSVVKDLVKTVAVGVIAYVGVDTFRKVLVQKSKDTKK